MATPGIVGERHYGLAQEIRRTLAQYVELKDIIAMLGEGTLKALAESGCVAMFIGRGSINQDSLTSVNKTNQVRTYKELIRRIYDHEIGIFAGRVVGMDPDDVHTFERTLEW